MHNVSPSGASEPGAVDDSEKPAGEGVMPGELAFVISQTIYDLLDRVSHEQDTRRVLDLMQAVRDGAEALSYLE